MKKLVAPLEMRPMRMYADPDRCARGFDSEVQTDRFILVFRTARQESADGYVRIRALASDGTAFCGLFSNSCAMEEVAR